MLNIKYTSLEQLDTFANITQLSTKGGDEHSVVRSYSIHLSPTLGTLLSYGVKFIHTDGEQKSPISVVRKTLLTQSVDVTTEAKIFYVSMCPK